MGRNEQLFAVFDEDDADDVDDTVKMRTQIESLNIEQQRQTDDHGIESKIL